MSSANDSTQRDPLDLLVEQFLQRHRAGEKVTVESFADAHPEAAGELRDLLPTLLALEGVKRDRASSGSSGRRVSLPALERLGDFRMVGELGRGGMGVVFEAVQQSLGRKVALKVMPQASLLTGNQLERFRREAQIAAQLHHSNIVPVFGSGESDGYHWYAMQFIAGKSLDVWRNEQQGALPNGSGAWLTRARFLARLGVQAASALAYAHAQGTMHRDIKPGNLLLEQNDHLWITDFGLAKALEAEGLTHSGDLLGTLQYMAPEQFAGSYDQRSEVYALGVTLYELLVLAPAFAGKNKSELMERIRAHRAEPLRRRCPELPEDLVVIVEKAMARDPADRYQSAELLEHDLTAFLEDRPIAARRQSGFALLRRWCRHNRLVAALAVCTLLAVVGAGVTGWIAFGEVSQQSARTARTLRKTLEKFSEMFDALVGPDPVLSLDEDPDSGEQTYLVRSALAPHDVDLLQKMLAFYNDFAAENADNQELRYETARAYRRLGTIRARLGKPEQFDTAADEFQQALDRLALITDRDVRREQAAVQVAFGQLEQRRGRFAEAGDRFREGLRLLDALPGEAGRAVRFEQAQAHYFLAQTFEIRGGRGAPPDREGQRREATDQVRQALVLAEGLLTEEPKNAEFRLLKARCLLRASSGPGRRPGADAPQAQRRQEMADEAIGILRDLVQSSPSAEARFELGRALLGGARGPWRQGREAPSLDTLREAQTQAERLVQELPGFEEYELLRAQVGLLFGHQLLKQAKVASEGTAAELEAMRQEGQAELAAAKVHAVAFCDQVEKRLPASPRPGDERLLPIVEMLLHNSDPELGQHLRTLLDKLPKPPDWQLRPDRPGSPDRAGPPDRRGH